VRDPFYSLVRRLERAAEHPTAAGFLSSSWLGAVPIRKNLVVVPAVFWAVAHGQVAQDVCAREESPEEEAVAKETLAMAGQVHPNPSTWPSQIKFRPKPRTSFGRQRSYVRSAEWLRGGR
jgi:hypothetical protein